MKILKFLWILFCALVGAAAGALLLGKLSSIPMSILGGVLGFAIGAAAGRYIPIEEWFT